MHSSGFTRSRLFLSRFALLSLVLCSFWGIAHAQLIYSKQQILAMMLESPTHYQLHPWDSLTVAEPERILRYQPVLYQREIDGQLSVLTEEMDQRTQILYDRAEALFNEGQFELALGFYQTIAEEHPELSVPMTYLGQTYRILEYYSRAKDCFIRAIKQNFHNYLAHWFLANIYWGEGKIKQAVHHITLAKILCRNNPTINISFEGIMRDAGRETSDLYLTPQLNIYKAEGDTIKIMSSMDWMFYGIVKAMWLFEPGFHQNEQVEPGAMNPIEMTELYLALVRDEKESKTNPRTDPILILLDKAHERKMDRAFVRYEMLLPVDPVAAVALPKKDILDIQKYLLKVKHKRI